MWTDADTRFVHRAAFAWDHAELDLIPPCRFIEELATPLPVRRRIVRPAGPPVAPPLPPEPPPTVTVERRLLRAFVGTLLVLGAVWVVVVAIGR